MRAELSDRVWNVAETFIAQVHKATGMPAIVCDGKPKNRSWIRT